MVRSEAFLRRVAAHMVVEREPCGVARLRAGPAARALSSPRSRRRAELSAGTLVLELWPAAPAGPRQERSAGAHGPPAPQSRCTRRRRGLSRHAAGLRPRRGYRASPLRRRLRCRLLARRRRRHPRRHRGPPSVLRGLAREPHRGGRRSTGLRGPVPSRRGGRRGGAGGAGVEPRCVRPRSRSAAGIGPAALWRRARQLASQPHRSHGGSRGPGGPGRPVRRRRHDARRRPGVPGDSRSRRALGAAAGAGLLGGRAGR